MNVLVVATHPDDETLGVGGTLALHHRRGDVVSVCVLTKGTPPETSEETILQKREELDNACETLGVSHIDYCEFPTARLDTVASRDISDALAKYVKKRSPRVVYMPFGGDLHVDHRIAYNSSLVATRPVSSGVKELLAYETVSETEWGYGMSFTPNMYVDISSVMEIKIRALKCYRSELRECPHPRSVEGVTTKAKSRGLDAGVLYAEAFMLLREVITDFARANSHEWPR